MLLKSIYTDTDAALKTGIQMSVSLFARFPKKIYFLNAPTDKLNYFESSNNENPKKPSMFLSKMSQLCARLDRRLHFFEKMRTVLYVTCRLR